MKFLAYWGILAVRIENKEECPKKDIHLQRLTQDATIMLQAHTSTGATPSFPQVYNMKGHVSRGSQSPVNRSYAGIQA